MKQNDRTIGVKIEVDDEELRDTCDVLEQIANNRPNITVRNNETVYVTINYFHEEPKVGD